ncbi:unnamed protein product [Acanthoscelides obtectus]|uniref:Uncharacterized protein n=1 Tax=Acanthoscelides obtectus TaxID=200917 RepID=A0A9P0M9Y2_ACAOB|nr:unnamed protein product [Acanthoscelides obtectus]CAK1677007.1 hypothetical protein AOBTE_LOCUS31062 [Acanthoscelides obtectus]
MSAAYCTTCLQRSTPYFTTSSFITSTTTSRRGPTQCCLGRTNEQLILLRTLGHTTIPSRPIRLRTKPVPCTTRHRRLELQVQAVVSGRQRVRSNLTAPPSTNTRHCLRNKSKPTT